MKPTAPLLDTVRGGNHLPWGVSCLCFSADAGASMTALLDYFTRRHVPVIVFATRPDNGAANADVRPLESIVLGERAA
jgi:hypothetical protein